MTQKFSSVETFEPYVTMYSSWPHHVNSIVLVANCFQLLEVNCNFRTRFYERTGINISLAHLWDHINTLWDTSILDSAQGTCLTLQSEVLSLYHEGENSGILETTEHFWLYCYRVGRDFICFLIIILISDTPFPEVMEHGLFSLPFDQAEIIEEIQSSEDSASELGAGPGKVVKKKQKWRYRVEPCLAIAWLITDGRTFTRFSRNSIGKKPKLQDLE